MESTPQEIYKERIKRVEDAIRLKVPDRVPFFAMTHAFAAKYAGMTPEEAFFDRERWLEANKRFNLDIQPDMYFPAVAIYPEASLQILDCKQIRWPRHGVRSRSTFQYVEGEYMKADEYDAFVNDPTDYLLRTYLPRVFGSLESLSKLPPLKPTFFYGYKLCVTSALFTMPEIAEAFKSIYEAGIEATKYLTAMHEFDAEMAELGYPLAFSGASVYAPFDVFSDMLRGMRGTMVDMYRQPGKLLEAMENVYPSLIAQAEAGFRRSGNPRVFIPLHRGADGFLSPKQFETFYWPGLKRLLLDLIDRGMTPCPFFEGNYTSRLKHLTELPKGKVMGIFDTTDIVKAKEMLGHTMCIAGNMPISLLVTGTPEKVKKYTKFLIDKVGKDGGFIMTSSTVLDDAEPELVKVWAEFTKEYGAYR